MPSRIYKRTKLGYWTGKRRSKETKRKISEKLKGSKGYWKNRSFTKEHKQKLSLAHKGQVSWIKGKFHTKETKNKISKANKGRKHTEETKRKDSLAKGGTGIPYENTEYGAGFNNALKEQIRYRDKYKCQVYECPQLENGRQLDVHHINYDKENCKENNLISLCINCHRKSNFNRDYWYAYFTYIMETCYVH